MKFVGTFFLSKLNFYAASWTFWPCDASKIDQRPIDSQFLHERSCRLVPDREWMGSALLTPFLTGSYFELNHIKILPRVVLNEIGIYYDLNHWASVVMFPIRLDYFQEVNVLLQSFAIDYTLLLYFNRQHWEFSYV